MVDLPIDEEMMRTIEAKYVNDTGFNYKWFLAELEPQEKDKLRYIEVRCDRIKAGWCACCSGRSESVVFIVLAPPVAAHCSGQGRATGRRSQARPRSNSAEDQDPSEL